MKRRAFLQAGGAMGGAMLLTGCPPWQKLASDAPAAKTPVLKSIQSVVPRTCSWTNFAPDAAGNTALLPSGHTTGDIRVMFQAPYPSSIDAVVNGQFVLPQAGNTQSLVQGYYKINSVNLAVTKDTFDWDVSFTPPASQRVAPGFGLAIANRSINPNLTGTDKVSAPLSLMFTRPPVPDLDAWLSGNTAIRDAIVWEASNGTFTYSSWSAQDKQFLHDTFAGAWNTNFLLLNDPPRNQVSLADTDDPKTALALSDAWPLFVSYVAYSLAAEVGGWTSWSLTGYSSDQLALLLDSREMFRWDGGVPGYVIHEGSTFDGVVPASPWTTLAFLYQYGIYTCGSQLELVELMLDWCRSNLVHFAGPEQAKNMVDQWQYRGVPPVMRIIQGTPSTSAWGADPNIRHRTAGCWGSTGFMRSILRVLNVPVAHEEHVGHAMPYFANLGLYLDHGDDPYNRLSKATPPFPARELLINQTTRDAWFGSSVPAGQQTANIGRRTRELGVKYLSDELLRNRCADLAAGTTNANSLVLQSLQPTFALSDLDGMTPPLWNQLDAKIQTFGGCTKIPA